MVGMLVALKWLDGLVMAQCCLVSLLVKQTQTTNAMLNQVSVAC